MKERAIIGYSRLARVAILLVLLGLALLVGWFYFVGPVFFVAGNLLPAYLLGSLAVWHPTLLFMVALWFLQRAAGIAPQFDGQRLARYLAAAGWTLMVGALANVTSRPLALNSGVFARHLAEQNLQFQVWTATMFDTFVAAAVIALAGLLLVLAGKVLRRQSAAAEELRQIF